MSDNQVRDIATRFIERADALRMKGAKADNAALDYFTGAAAGAEIAGNHELAKRIGLVCALTISVRGMFAVRELARD